MLASLLAAVLLLSSMPSVAYAVEGKNGAAVVTGQEATKEESGTEAETEIPEQEESKTEDKASEADGGEKEIGETPPEGDSTENGERNEPADSGEAPDDDGNVSGAEEGGAGEAGAEDAAEETEKTEADGTQGEASKDVLPEQTEAVAAEIFALEESETSGSCGANVTWRFEDGVLTISGSGAMEDYQSPHDVKGKSAPWYQYYRNDIKRVVVEDGVTTIGGYAFYVCLHMTSIELPSSITTIGESAFSNCGGLINIELPSGVTTIRESAFNNCWSLTSINLPSGITIIEKGTFDMCQSLTGIELPSGVTTIGAEAFSGCDSLTGIELPSGVTTIGEYAFSGCDNLTSIKLPSGVTIIEKGTFAVCGSLTSIELPSGITSIGANAFFDCGRLTSIELPADVTTIGESAFWSCGRLSGIELPSGVTAIGAEAFGYCTGLTSIELPSGVTTIGKSAFSDCGSLTSIKLPSGITTIEESVFRRCHDLTDIELPSGVTTIGESAFKECSGLTSIGLPLGLTTIGNAAFQNCTSLKDVYYDGSESDWRAITIGKYNEPLTSVAIYYNSELDSTLPVKRRSFAFCDPPTVWSDWGWNYILDHNSTEYIHEVSTVALVLSAATERSQSDIETMLAGHNFGVDADLTKSVHYDESFLNIENPACTFAHKTIKNNGEKEHVIIIVGRGTSTWADWATDLNAITTDHFWIAANNIWNDFDEWLNAEEIDGEKLASAIGNGNVKFFVTGHSLGGAVANRVAYKLTQLYGQENVYAYTFASPPTEGQSSTYAPNIFNVLCKGDPVPYLGAYTDGRYGDDLWFADSCRLPVGFPILGFFDNHVVESYMKHLLNISYYRFKTAMKAGGSWCPVDLRIYNSSGQLVGSVTNNVVDKENITDSVMIVLSGENNDEKNFYFLTDDTYTIEFIGTGDGTLKYAIRDIYADKSRIDEKVFNNVTLTAGKKMTSLVSAWDVGDTEVDTSGLISTPDTRLFVLDDSGTPVKEVLADDKGSEIPLDQTGEVLPGDIPADGKIPDGLWIAGVEDSYTYTGAAIKPEIRVYDGKKKLQPGKDYTASYKNNTRANDASNASKAPAVVVRGKGNYTGTETATFKITAVALSDDSISVEDMTTAYNKKVQKKVPVVSYNGRKLTKNRDFTVSYPNGESGAYKEAGVYEVLLTAKAGGNFSGTRTVACIITDSILLGKVSVKKIPDQTYTGEAIEPEFAVTYKNKPLIKGTDYTVSYTDHTQIGTAKAILTGIGKYAGTKKVSFRITGTPLKGAVVAGMENKVYNGNDQKQNITVTLSGRTLEPGTDYEAVYTANREAGKASVTIRGKGAYTGTIKKTFRIERFDLAANRDGRLIAEVKQETVPYAKGGAKPGITVKFRTEDGGWRTLSEGKDYTLSYQNHTAVNDGSRAEKQPAVTVKGKGNFSGTYGTALGFQIAAQDLSRLTLTAQDKTYQNKKNSFATKLSITDLNGKILKAGTDYQKAFIYLYKKETDVSRTGGEKVTRAAGTVVDKEDIIPAGTALIVRAVAKEGGNYTGTLEGEYRITKAAISSASVSVPKQIYTGQPITLEKSLLAVKIKGKPLDGSQYEIVPGSYKNNVKKGTASVTIRGTDNYGGTKTVKFTIRAKGFLWWWR